jgi:hypothetical protein
MKKLFSLILLITLFTTACGIKGTHVTCTSNTTVNGMTIKQEYILSYAKDSVTNVEINKSYSFTDEKKFESFGVVINNTVSNMKSISNDHIKFSNNTNNKTYSTKLTVDMKKSTKDELSTLGFNKNLTDFKTTLTNQGLTCK